jgi:hypothetical protein
MFSFFGFHQAIAPAGNTGTATKQAVKLSRQGASRVGLIVNYFVGALPFFPFPSWQQLLSAASLIAALSFRIRPRNAAPISSRSSPRARWDRRGGRRSRKSRNSSAANGRSA